MTKRIYSHLNLSGLSSIKSYPLSKNNKGTLSYFTPAKIIKMFSGLFLRYLTGVINHAIATSFFPNEKKLEEVMSAFNKDDSLDKENYQSISLLFDTSQIYEKLFFNQISD